MSGTDPVWPWDRMINLRDVVFEPNGIDVIFDEPKMPKEDVLEWEAVTAAVEKRMQIYHSRRGQSYTE